MPVMTAKFLTYLWFPGKIMTKATSSVISAVFQTSYKKLSSQYVAWRQVTTSIVVWRGFAVLLVIFSFGKIIRVADQNRQRSARLTNSTSDPINHRALCVIRLVFQYGTKEEESVCLKKHNLDYKKRKGGILRTFLAVCSGGCLPYSYIYFMLNMTLVLTLQLLILFCY